MTNRTPIPKAGSAVSVIVENWEVRNCSFARDISSCLTVADRRILEITTEESEFLNRCASQVNWTPDYSRGIVITEGYFALLSNVRLIGRSGAVACNEIVIVDSMLHLKKLTRSNSYRTKFSFTQRREARLATSIFYLPEAEANIYHWLIDCLPRLWVLSQATTSPLILYCHENMTPYQIESLAPFLQQTPNLQIATIAFDECVDIDQYLFTSFLSGLNSGAVNPVALNYVRQTLLDSAKVPCARGPDRIYISRTGARDRSLTNEVEIEGVLRKNGFQIVHPEKLSIWEQISVFKEAKCIVGAHGAGFANMIFARAACIVEFLPKCKMRPHYLLLAKSLGFEYKSIIGSETDVQGRFCINKQALVSTLSALGI